MCDQLTRKNRLGLGRPAVHGECHAVRNQRSANSATSSIAFQDSISTTQPIIQRRLTSNVGRFLGETVFHPR
ncbi:MAG: hypothetical protein N2C14_10575, partial [Planctomycetales bacterium]